MDNHKEKATQEQILQFMTTEHFTLQIDLYNVEHNRLYKSKWSKLVTLNAPFTLIAMLFIFALVITFWGLKYSI